MLTCKELIEFLDAYLAGELPLVRQASFKLHLALCRDCRAYLDSYRRTMELSKLAMTPDEPVPAEVPSEMVKAIQDAMAKK